MENQKEKNGSDWKVVKDKLIKKFSFKSYDEVLDFVNKIGKIAEKQNHHPEMVVKYNEVIVKMFDHEENKISEKCYKFTNSVDKMTIKSQSKIDERSRSFAFTRKKRLFSKPERMSNPMRYRKVDRIKEGVEEKKSITIGDICIFKLDFNDADFWLKRKGSEKTVGTPTKDFNKEDIGVKVRDEYKDRVDSNYLYYYFQFLHQSGIFIPHAHGTLNLKNIKLDDIKRIPVSFK